MVANRRLLTLSVLFLLIAGCHRKPATPPPAPLKQNLFVLLPQVNGSPSMIIVSNGAGKQEVKDPYTAVRVQNANQAPSTPFPMGPDEVKRRFGAVLDAMPADAAQFTLLFDPSKDELTAESTALIPTILEAIRARRSTDVSVIGHTDTTGDPESNYRLGLRRAQTVADILRADGLDAASITIASHGENDLLVKTPRGVPEPRNRRVEISVR